VIAEHASVDAAHGVEIDHADEKHAATKHSRK
jgi:hypothetical protein